VNAKVKAKAKAKVKAKRNQRDGGISQKVWRGQPGRARVTPPTIRRSRRYNAPPTQDDERSQIVKTLRDATLKMKGLYKMMGEFVVTAPKKINYKKVHTKWRKMKKQIQFGGDDFIKMFNPDAPPTDEEPIPFFRTVDSTLVKNGKYIINANLRGKKIRCEYIPVDTADAEQKKKIEEAKRQIESNKAAAAAKKAVDAKKADVNADDESESDDDAATKDCLEKKEKPTFLVKQSAVNPDKFAVERIDTDSMIEGSLTRAAESFMKSATASNIDHDDIDENEDGMGDGMVDGKGATKANDIISDGSKEDTELRIAAAGVILIALEALKNVNDVVASTSDDTTRAAAAMIAIALGGLIKKKKDEPGGPSKSTSSSSVQTEEDTATKEALEEAQRKKLALEKKLDEKEREVEARNSEVSRLQERLVKSDGTNVELQGQLQIAIQAQQQAEVALAETNRQLGIAQQAVQDATARRVEANKRAFDANQRATAAAEGARQAETAAAYAGQQSAKSQADVQRLTKELSQAKAAAAAAEETAVNANREKAAAEAAAATARDEAQTARDAVTAADATNAANAAVTAAAADAADAAVATAQRAVSEATQRAANARAEAAAANVEVQRITAQRDELTAENSQLKAQQTELERQHAAQAATASEELVEERARARENAERLQIAQAQLDELLKEKAEAQQKAEAEQSAAKKIVDSRTTAVDAVKNRLRDNLSKLLVEIGKAPADRQAALNEQVIPLRASIEALTFENMTSEEPRILTKIQDILESTGTKIRTFIVMKGGGKEPTDGGFTMADKTVSQTSEAQAGGGTTMWGPFSDVFDESKTNQDKYDSIKPVIETLPQGKTLVVFGYGYSGSGKTYTLLGENSVLGVTQIAIQDYITSGKKVAVVKAFEYYNNSYDAKTVIDRKLVGYTRTTETVYFSNVEITNVPYFNGMCAEIENLRKTNGHIKPTPNNPASSRGHLFIHLSITDHTSRTTGNLIICDMGGRENPDEMWKKGEYCKGAHSEGPVVRGKPGKYYNKTTGVSAECNRNKQGTILKQTMMNASNISGQTASLALGLISGSNDYIKTMLKEGAYINDSINELLDFFKFHFESKGTGWTKEKLEDSRAQVDVYHPDQLVTIKGTSAAVGINPLFETFAQLTPGKIKYFTFACIRPSKEFLEDSKNTMNFAEKVNSCPEAKFDKLQVSASPHPSAAPDDDDDDDEEGVHGTKSATASKSVASAVAAAAQAKRDTSVLRAAGLSSKEIHKWDFATQTRQFHGKPNDSSQVGSSLLHSQRNGGSLRKKSKRNKSKNSKSTLKAKSKAKAKSNPAHNHQKKKFTRKHKHNKNNKNKSTIKNRN
jgi:hypothetical protein